MRRVVMRAGVVIEPTSPERAAEFERELASRESARPCGTDKTNFAGVAAGDPLEGISPLLRPVYERAAREQGVDLNGKKLFSGMMRHKMDIAGAVFSSTDDIRKAVRDRGWESHGMVEERGIEPIGVNPLDEPYKVANDIVVSDIERHHSAEEWKELKPQQRTDLMEQTQKRLSGAA